jgi:hypothetical protein
VNRLDGYVGPKPLFLSRSDSLRTTAKPVGNAMLELAFDIADFEVAFANFT